MFDNIDSFDIQISCICMMICMDADFFFLLLENLRERGGGRKLMQIEVFCNFHDIIGFKVTMTVLHVFAFAVVSLYTCMWLPIWRNRQRGLKGSHTFSTIGT